MRSFLRFLLTIAFIGCFIAAFSFKVTGGGPKYSKLEVGFIAGPWWTRVDRGERVTNETDPLAGAALCAYALPLLAIGGRLLRPRVDPS